MLGNWIIPLIIALVALAFYAIVPLLVRSKQWFSTRPEISEINDALMSHTALAYCRQIEPALESLGFSPMAYIRVRGFCFEQESYLRVYTHPETHNVAVATEILQKMPNGKDLQVHFIEFNTEFADGREISLTNSDLLQPPGMCKNRIGIFIPNEADLSALYKLFRELKLYYGKGEPDRVLEHAHVVDEIRKSLMSQMHCLVEHGHMVIDEAKQQFLLTYKGAYSATLTHMWPFKQIMQKQTRKKARKLMAASGH